MTFRTLRSLGSISILLSSIIACDPAEPEPGEGSGTTAGTSDPSTGTTAEDPSSTSAASTGAPDLSCAEATTPDECAAASDEVQSCGWFPTTIVQDLGTCEAAETSGVCLVTDMLDGCGEIFPGDACEDIGGAWLVRTLPDGSVELLPDPPTCSDGGFDICPSPGGEGSTGGDDELAAACACACVLAGA